MNKKILLISALEPWSIKDKVGAPSLYETLKGYSVAGYEIIYLTYNKNQGSKNFGHAHNIDPIFKNLKTIRVKKISAPNFFGARISGRLNRTYFFPYAMYKGVKKYLREQENPPEIIYAYEEQAIYATSLLKKKDKAERLLIHRLQGTILGKKYNNIIYCFRRYISFRALRLKGDKYIMTNDGTFGDKALKYWNNDVNDDNLLFVRNGFQFEQFTQKHDREKVIKELGLDPNNLFAFTVSRLAQWKRVDRAIELINKFKIKHPNLHLIIIGDGEQKETLQQLVNKYELNEKVHFLGGLGREKVAKLMACLDIFLSLYDVSNLGNPLFEAMISSQCVVTLNNGTTSEVIEHNNNGVIVDPEDTTRLEDEFEILILNAEKRERLRLSAKKWANDNLYSWDDRMNNEIKWINS